MKQLFKMAVCAAMVLAMTAAYAAEAQPKKIRYQPSQTVLLYPEGQDSACGLPETLGPLENNGFNGVEETDAEGGLHKIGEKARMDLYFPKKPTGQMVIICPGGGYTWTSARNEGIMVANWMMAQGITCCVVKYRHPNGHWLLPLQDVQNAFRYCRAHASEWKVKQIGIIGFSAGGHLAASASTMFTDKVTRPDFSVLIYPVISMNKGITHKGTRNCLIGKDEKWNDESVNAKQWKANMRKHGELLAKYSLDRQVTSDTPDTFIALSTDDKTVPVVNSILYYSALVDCKVSAEMHIFPEGGHGWGFTPQEYQFEGQTDKFAYARSEFETSLLRWLKNEFKKAE